jgi:hypothetical protein
MCEPKWIVRCLERAMRTTDELGESISAGPYIRRGCNGGKREVSRGLQPLVAAGRVFGK